jgi:hypothetical protein
MNSNDCIKYRIVELDSIDSIIKWVVDHLGSDLIIDGTNHCIWVLVPFELFDQFMLLYGSQVSAI